MYGTEYAATVPVEHVFAFRVTDAIDDVTGDLLHVDIGFSFDFSRDDGLSRGHQCFAGNFGVRFERDDFV